MNNMKKILLVSGIIISGILVSQKQVDVKLNLRDGSTISGTTSTTNV